MVSNRIKITEEGEVYGRLEIALAIRNSTYNDEINCSLMDKNIIKNCETCSLKFICDGIDGLDARFSRKDTDEIAQQCGYGSTQQGHRQQCIVVRCPQ